MSIYSSIPAPRLARNNFNFTHRNLFSFNFHELIPVLRREVLPGDKHRQATEQFVRFAPMIAPILSEIKMSQQSFFVPLRTVSNKWEQFITGGKDGTFADVLPYTTYDNLYECISDALDLLIEEYGNIPESGSGRGPAWQAWLNNAVYFYDCLRFLEYMGLDFSVVELPSSVFVGQSLANASTSYTAWYTWKQTQTDNSLGHLGPWSGNETPINLAVFYAFQKIYDEYYRDENLEESCLDAIDVCFKSAGYPAFRDTVGFVDFFNSFSLVVSDVESPWQTLFAPRKRAWQKDRFTAALPFTQRGPEVTIPISGTVPVHGHSELASGTYDLTLDTSADPEKIIATSGSPSATGPANLSADFDDADLTSTINDFRRAERLQRWYENSARGGARLNENTLAHWGVRTPDSTLDRSEFLGGSSIPVVVSEIPQTSETTSESAQGTLAGKGTAYNSGYLYSRFFSEHGFVFVIASCMVKPVYMSGTDRIYTRQSRFEYAWPEFANIGEEPVLNRELYTGSDPLGVFGYLPRYFDYKSAVSETHGQFKNSLKFWHLAREFASQPKLNKEFIMSSPSYRSFAVESPNVEHLYCTMIFHERISRLLPYYGVPTI